MNVEDKSNIRDLVHNPSSLKFLSVCRVRQSISCIGENIEKNLIEKLTAGDLNDLRNPSVPISLEDMCKYDNYSLKKIVRPL